MLEAMLTDITDNDIEFFRSMIIGWGKANFAEFPWRETNNRWHALVAEIMLQRTKAEQVLATYLSFTEKYPTAKDYVADENSLVFSGLGLIWREKYLRQLGVFLLENPIPEDKEELTLLPGVGSYVAAAFRSLHIGIRDVIIDSNIVRLYGRYFGFETDGETRRKRWFVVLAETLTPQDDFRPFNYGLLDFTRSICKPRPECAECPLCAKCVYFSQNA